MGEVVISGITFGICALIMFGIGINAIWGSALMKSNIGPANQANIVEQMILGHRAKIKLAKEEFTFYLY